MKPLIFQILINPEKIWAEATISTKSQKLFFRVLFPLSLLIALANCYNLYFIRFGVELNYILIRFFEISFLQPLTGYYLSLLLINESKRYFSKLAQASNITPLIIYPIVPAYIAAIPANAYPPADFIFLFALYGLLLVYFGLKKMNLTKSIRKVTLIISLCILTGQILAGVILKTITDLFFSPGLWDLLMMRQSILYT